MTTAARSVPAVKNPGTAGAIIAVASSQIGYTEGPDNDTIYGLQYGLNHQPWCGEFVTWCSRVAGCQGIIPKFAYTPAGAQWFKDRGKFGHTPKVGAIAFYDTAGLGRISHTGIVDRVFPDGSWTSIEGNTNAAGSREGRVVRRQKRRTTGPRGGFGYPVYRVIAKVPPTDVVDLSDVIGTFRSTKSYVGPVARALQAEGLTPDRAGYAAWQRKLGYSGSDADGEAGQASLTKLGAKHGFKVVA